MRKIIRIVGHEERLKNNERYTITHALLEDGEEVTGWGSEFEVGDEVMTWWDEQHNKAKMKRKDS